MKQGMKLMTDPRVMKMMQDPRVMKAVMTAMSVPGKVQTFGNESGRENREGDGARDGRRSQRSEAHGA